MKRFAQDALLDDSKLTILTRCTILLQMEQTLCVCPIQVVEKVLLLLDQPGLRSFAFEFPEDFLVVLVALAVLVASIVLVEPAVPVVLVVLVVTRGRSGCLLSWLARRPWWS